MNSELSRLIHIVEKLSQKIEKLETIVNTIVQCSPNKSQYSAFPSQVPFTPFENFVDTFIISESHLLLACQTSILESFKTCICDNLRLFSRSKKNTLPLFVKPRPKKLFVYSYPVCSDTDEHDAESDEFIWQLFDHVHLSYLVQEIWRKYLMLFLELKDTVLFSNFENGSPEKEKYCDICMKNILEMKKNLLQKHSKEIMRCLMNETDT